jgi:hypothetical protein
MITEELTSIADTRDAVILEDVWEEEDKQLICPV